MNTLQASWASFEKRCVAAGATPQFRASLRIAFYSGAIDLHGIQANNAGGNQEAFAQILKTIEQEMLSFLQEMIAAERPSKPRPSSLTFPCAD